MRIMAISCGSFDSRLTTDNFTQGALVELVYRKFKR